MIEKINHYPIKPIFPLQKAENKDNPEKRRREREQKVTDELNKNKTERDKVNNIDITI